MGVRSMPDSAGKHQARSRSLQELLLKSVKEISIVDIYLVRRVIGLNGR